MSPPDLRTDRYLGVTPAGAYLATQAPDDEPARRVLLALLAAERTPAARAEDVAAWSGRAGADAATALLAHLAKLALIEGHAAPRTARAGTLEALLPELLAPLSSTGRALLADAQGFYLATAGFPHESAEELSALTADLSSLQQRHARLLENNLGLRGASWALVDAAGNSRLGVWPLFVGKQRFALVIAGAPRLNQPVFVELVGALARRYANVADAIPTGPRAAAST